MGKAVESSMVRVVCKVKLLRGDGSEICPARPNPG